MTRQVAASGYLRLLATLAIAVTAAVACAPAPSEQADPGALVPLGPVQDYLGTPTASYYLPQKGSWDVPSDAPTARIASQEGTVDIEGLGSFAFNPSEVTALRPDMFWHGHFSLFDVVAHLADEGWFTMSYHYDSRLDTYVIEEVDGEMNWWYRAHYAGGWYDINAFRMDMYPYKDGTRIRLLRQDEDYLGRIYNSFADEVARKSINLGRVVVPEVRIGTNVFTDVPVSCHDVRADLLQPGTITALDVLLSLADQKKLNQVKLTWYAGVSDDAPVDSFLVEQIDDGDGLFDDEASPESGRWLYEAGAREFPGFQGSHISIPSDVRILVSPDYVSWYWLD